MNMNEYVDLTMDKYSAEPEPDPFRAILSGLENIVFKTHMICTVNTSSTAQSGGGSFTIGNL